MQRPSHKCSRSLRVYRSLLRKGRTKDQSPHVSRSKPVVNVPRLRENFRLKLIETYRFVRHARAARRTGSFAATKYLQRARARPHARGIIGRVSLITHVRGKLIYLGVEERLVVSLLTITTARQSPACRSSLFRGPSTCSFAGHLLSLGASPVAFN